MCSITFVYLNIPSIVNTYHGFSNMYYMFSFQFHIVYYILEKLRILDRLNFGKIEFGENLILRKVYLVANAFIHIKFDTNCAYFMLYVIQILVYIKKSSHLNRVKSMAC